MKVKKEGEMQREKTQRGSTTFRVVALVASAGAATSAFAQESWTLGGNFLPASVRATNMGDFGGGLREADVAQEPDDGAADLAMKLSNPVADLISVPFQFNVDHGLGSTDATRILLNLQPVIPFEVNHDWNLITRTILPIVQQDELVKGAGDNHGIGDVLQSFFLSPKEPMKGWIVGAGPVISWPTASDDALGSEKYGFGPTAVALKQQGGWTWGALVNHVWSLPSLGNNDRRGVSQTFLQPFAAFTTPRNTTLTVNMESIYDWQIDRWTIPLNAFVSQLLMVRGHPISVFAGVRSYLDVPQGGPNWGIRFGVTFLFPKH